MTTVPYAPQDNKYNVSKQIYALTNSFPDEVFVFNKEVIGSFRYTIDVFMPDYGIGIDFIEARDSKTEERTLELQKLMPNVTVIASGDLGIDPLVLVGKVYKEIRSQCVTRAEANNMVSEARNLVRTMAKTEYFKQCFNNKEYETRCAMGGMF